MSDRTNGRVMSDWSGQRVLVIGAARQGLALGRYLALHGAQVLINDRKSAEELADGLASFGDLDGATTARIRWHLGDHSLDLLDGIDCVCPSGGVTLELPLIREARKRGIPLSNDSQVFLEACPCKTVGITGSAGKTTTTSLVGRIAQVACESTTAAPYRKVWVGGNIGSPLISVVDEMQADDLAVLELSSFQLEIMTRSVHVACVLNITPNHLDRHASMESYTAAKKRLLDFQAECDAAVLGCDDPGSWALLEAARAKRYTFGKFRHETLPGAFIEQGWVCLWDGKQVRRVLKLEQIRLRGWHNVENVLAACAISMAAGLPVKAMKDAVAGFTGVAHRLEWVHAWRGADWYNDSIATAPERVMAAIHAFDTPDDIGRPIVLLAGGRDKNLPWEDLASLIHQRVEHLICFGEAAGKVAAAVGEITPGTRPATLDTCPGLQQAVNQAARLVEPGDIVLLSPGATSFDEFRDFEQRGEAFKRWVFNLSCA